MIDPRDERFWRPIPDQDGPARSTARLVAIYVIGGHALGVVALPLLVLGRRLLRSEVLRWSPDYHAYWVVCAVLGVLLAIAVRTKSRRLAVTSTILVPTAVLWYFWGSGSTSEPLPGERTAAMAGRLGALWGVLAAGWVRNLVGFTLAGSAAAG